MELVIKIPEDYYEIIKHDVDKGMDYLPCVLIANGTPLPKEHGRLIILSEDELKKNQINVDFSCQKWISEVGLSKATVAIIKADKGE